MISKKDLLKEMNISYGQLYRWKREGLIPDEWFIKQSVASGQETYFKDELIIPRIKKILELKDKYQLEQLKDFFSPDMSVRTFSIRELLIIQELDPLVIREFLSVRETLSIVEVAMIYILSGHLDILDYKEYAKYDFSHLKNVDIIFYVIQCDKYYILIGDNNLVLDKKITIYSKTRVEDVAKLIAERLG